MLTCVHCQKSFKRKATGVVPRYCSAKCRRDAWTKANPEKDDAIRRVARAKYAASHPRQSRVTTQRERDRARMWAAANPEKVTMYSRRWQRNKFMRTLAQEWAHDRTYQAIRLALWDWRGYLKCGRA